MTEDELTRRARASVRLAGEGAQDTGGAAGGQSLVPVDFDPFAPQGAMGPDAQSLVPVDHDPFAEPPGSASGTAPASTFADPGVPSAIAAKAAQGLTFGFSDEALGAIKSGFGFLSPMDEAIKHERDILAGASEHHPIVSAASEIGGGLATMVVPGLGALNAARGAGLGARVFGSVLTGGAYGGAYGAGTAEGGLPERAMGAAQGAATGAVVGSALPVLGAAIRGGYNAVVRPVRGVLGAEGEASRRVAGALRRDGVDPQQAVTGLAAARAAGVPATIADRGGEVTRSLARSAANTSPEARAALNTATEGRMESQKDRFFALVRGMVGNANATQTRERLQEMAQRALRPAYRRAYREGDRSIWSPELERLASSPDVVAALRQAATRGQSRAVVEGYGGFRPGVLVTPDGRVSFPRGPNGVPAFPNLQFWDYAKRELDDAANAAMRAGENERADVLRQLARGLRTELDNIVPSYGAARSTAARFFGADNALEAGENFVSSRVGNEEARRVVAGMSDVEQALFREGFASRLIESVREAGDRTNVINSIFLKSPAALERIAIALGPREARGIEAFLRVENCFDLLRRAVQGNSTTVRQLAEAGLAGGAGVVLSGGDMFSPTAWFTGLALYTARRGTVLIDQRVARRVGEMLASDDPAVFQQVIALASRNPAVANLIRATEQNLARLVGPVQGGYPARAEENGERPPGPGGN